MPRKYRASENGLLHLQEPLGVDGSGACMWLQAGQHYPTWLGMHQYRPFWEQSLQTPYSHTGGVPFATGGSV